MESIWFDVEESSVDPTMDVFTDSRITIGSMVPRPENPARCLHQECIVVKEAIHERNATIHGYGSDPCIPEASLLGLYPNFETSMVYVF